jgi:HD-GYP domain-containing protein (c-di-GMP phosphodiesterase class II)
LNINKGGASKNPITFAPIPLYDEKTNKPNYNNVVTNAALTKEVINIEDVYNSEDYNFEGVKSFDKTMGYRTVSMLTIPMKNHEGDVNAVLQLINARTKTGEIVEFKPNVQRVIEALASQASISLNNQQLIQAHKNMMEAFIEVMAKAIDAKSPYTSAHCQRVPVITKMIAMAADISEDPAFKDFHLDEDDWYALHIASWLHDCGKIVTPEYVVDKATKLETVHNRIHEIRARFEILRRDAHILYLKKRLKNMGTQKELLKEYNAKIKKLEKDFAFIAKMNVGDEFMSDENKDEINRISDYQYTRYFDRALGLSWQEKAQIEDDPPPLAPAKEPLLEDRKEHIFGEYNRGELHNLLVPKGTLNPEEFEKIKGHVVQSIDILNSLPFPKYLKKVPEYAGGHHERMDGKGYPNELTKEQMSIPARIMAVADIFEALTANDRPYKIPKKLSEVLSIMSKMRDTGHIDPDIFKLFLTSGVYKDYAHSYISQDQLDEVNISQYL